MISSEGQNNVLTKSIHGDLLSVTSTQDAMICKYCTEEMHMRYQEKSYVLRRVLVELPRPSTLRKRLIHFPFEIIIWDAKVF
jgi:hypothetical protein